MTPPAFTRQRPAAPLSAAALSRRGFLLGGSSLVLLAGCAAPSPAASPAASAPATGTATGPLGLSAIPDQDPELLGRLYGLVADRIGEAVDRDVEYTPLTDYTAVVRAFEIGDIHLAWMGGLTGVQARSRVKGAKAIAQRDIDAEFHTLFIASTASGLEPFDEVDGLTALAGHTLTFGSETSTSGRLMPQYFLDEAGLDLGELQGAPGFSGSHDATIEAVASGGFEVGAVNEQVWLATEEAGEVDLSGVTVLFRSPPYADYHWLAHPQLDELYGEGATERITQALLALDADEPDDLAILELFGAESFVATKNANYDRIEDVAREQGLLT